MSVIRVLRYPRCVAYYDTIYEVIADYANISNANPKLNPIDQC